MFDLHIPPLQPAGSPELAAASLAAIEYTLASSIAIRDASDIQSVNHWSERLEPFQHQVQNLITFCRFAPVHLIADDVGMGKTISAGLIVSELMVRKVVRRVLILAPKILLPQWQEELKHKFGIHSQYGTGQEVMSIAGSRTPVLITTYASARSRLDQLAEADFDMLILDEAHKLRNLFGTPKAPKIATAIRDVAASGAFPYMLFLTATPVQNRLWDLYSLVDILATGKNHRNPLGEPGEFANNYLADRSSARILRHDAVPRFRRTVGEYMVRSTRLESGLSFPDRQVEQWHCPPSEVERQLESILKKHLPKMHALQKVQFAVALMSSPRAFAEQMHRSKDRHIIPHSVLDKVKEIADASPLGCKLPRLMELVTTLRERQPDTWRLIVFTRRIATQRELGRELEALGIKVGYIGGGHGRTQDSDIRQFQQEPPGVNVIVSTDAGAEGVNLQAANIVVNYDLPWNPMVLEQRIGRVQRLGSKHTNVIIANLVVTGSIEELVVGRLVEKLQLVSAAIGDIEGILEVAGQEESFEKEIERLVLLALEGQDIDGSRRQIEESIDAAKKLYDESRALVNESLGTLNSMHNSGPPPPQIEPVVPRLSARNLVTLHFQQDGEVVELDDGRVRVRQKGLGLHFATFNPTDPHLSGGHHRFGRNPTVYYAPGERPFERVIGSHSTKRLHAADLLDTDEEDLMEAARQWLDSLQLALVFGSAAIQQRTIALDGTVTALVTSAVAVDRIQRLVTINSPHGGWSDGSGNGEVRQPLRPDGILDQGTIPDAALESLTDAITNDPSIRSFTEFYQARLKAEVSKTASHTGAERRIRDSFTPATTAELVSISGTLDSRTTVEVNYKYPEGAASSAVLIIDGRGEPVTTPALETCAITGLECPEQDLSTCSVTGQRALSHRMLHSSVSEQLVLPEAATFCELSGDVLLPAEAQISAFSRRKVAPHHLVRCAVSNALAATDEVGTCDFTGDTVHLESLVGSEVSQRRYRADQEAKSVISGAKGHVSEFVRCELSHDLVLPAEAEHSAASGKLVRRDWLEGSQKNPERLAARQEMVRCAVNGTLLLPDEAAPSAVSGLMVDSDLLVASDLTGERALPDELFVCEESETRVLPAETDTCAVTGKRVRKDLLETSDASGRTVLKRFLLSCPETGKRGTKEEFTTCEVTGLLVAPSARGECTVTGNFVVRRLLIECACCSQLLLRTEAVETSTKVLVHPAHAVTSAFSDRVLPQSKVSSCKASGLPLEAAFLGHGYAQPLLEAASRIHQPPQQDPELLTHIVNALSERNITAKPRALWTAPTPKLNLIAIVTERRRVLRFNPERLAFMYDTKSGEITGTVSKIVFSSGLTTFERLLATSLPL